VDIVDPLKVFHSFRHIANCRRRGGIIEASMNDMRPEFLADQPSLPGLCPISDAIVNLSLSSGADERGAIFTRREVVDPKNGSYAGAASVGGGVGRPI
jgi:hypothetical protein